MNRYNEQKIGYISFSTDYSQFSSNQGGRQTNTNQQPLYRGQSPYKQPPQAPPPDAQRNAAYAQPNYNSQQDVYVQNTNPQEYNENYNTAVSEEQCQISGSLAGCQCWSFGLCQ
jgi:hypothetical protein